MCLLDYTAVTFRVCISSIVTPCSSGFTTGIETLLFYNPRDRGALKMNACTEIACGWEGVGECVWVWGRGGDGGADSQ